MVVGVGATVVGVTTVVGGGVVVVGLVEPFGFERACWVVDEATTWEWRATGVAVTCATRRTFFSVVVVVGATDVVVVVVVAIDVVVVAPTANVVLG